MKLLIGAGITDTKAYCLDEVISCLKALEIPTAITSKGLMFILNTNNNEFYNRFADTLSDKNMPYMMRNILPDADSMKNKVAVREALRLTALNTGCDALLMLDADIGLKPHTLLQMLACREACGADVVTTPYNTIVDGKLEKCVFKEYKGGYYLIRSADLHDFMTVCATGLGCCLILGLALQTPFRVCYNGSELELPEDLQWCADLKKRGIPVWCNADDEVQHFMK